MIHQFKYLPGTVIGYRKNGKPIYPIAGGSEDAGFVAPVETPPVAESTDGGNPAWAPILSQLPDSLHHVITPELQKWDSSVNQRIQTIQEEFAPWKKFADQGVDPEAANYAWGLLLQLQDNPQEFYNAIGEHFGFSQAQVAAIAAEAGDGELQVAPEIQQLQEGYETLAKIILGQQQQTEAQAADQQVESLLEEMHSAAGDFNENFVLTQMLNGATPEQALQSWSDLQTQILTQNNRPAPRVLGSGSGVPANPTNPAEMSGADRRKLVASILQANANTP